jgi:transposase
MGPYSMDLRERVIAAVDAHEGSLRQLACRYRIGLSTLTRWLRRRRRCHTLAPKPHGGGHPPALDAAARRRLRATVRKQPDATLEELARRIGVRCSRMAIFRTLKKLRISRKKKSLHAQQRDSPRVRRKRRLFRLRMALLDPACLVFIDETGATTAMTRTYGRAPIGQRVRGSVPGHWKSVTLVSGVRLSGIVAPMAFEGAMDTPHFRAYVEQILKPQLHAGDVVIWDNLKPHQNAFVRQAVEAAKAEVVPLPPYSPDLTPIEELWSKVKGVLRSIGARVVPAVYRAMKVALESVRPRDILAWFKYCGLCPAQA